MPSKTQYGSDNASEIDDLDDVLNNGGLDTVSHRADSLLHSQLLSTMGMPFHDSKPGL